MGSCNDVIKALGLESCKVNQTSEPLLLIEPSAYSLDSSRNFFYQNSNRELITDAQDKKILKEVAYFQVKSRLL